VDVLYAAGKYADAEAMAEEALGLRREAFGPTHAAVASSLDDLGAVVMARGDAARAEALMREALAMRRTMATSDDASLSNSLNNLAYVTWRNGNPKEAESMFREALDLDRRRLGDEDPEVATKLINVAVVVRDQGRPEDAEPLVREAIEIQRKVLGDRHPTLANSLDVLAGTFEDRGDNAHAETLLREALALATAADVKLDISRLESNLGWVLWKAGAYREAEPLLRSAVADVPATYGPRHRNTRLAISHLAHELNSLGDARGAESTARAALAMFREAPSDHSVVTALVALGHALIAQGRIDDAVSPLREALTIFDGQVPVRFQWMKGEAQSALGGVLAARGQSAEAETLLLAGYDGLRGMPSTSPPRLRLAVERIVSFYVANGKHEEAAAWRQRLHEIGHSAVASKRSARAEH
jgi:tetratricopeptide (TPR) repeat protein